MITKWVVVFQHGMCTARNPTNAKTSSGVNIIFYFFCAFFIRFSILNKTRIFIFLCIFIRQVFFCFFLTICGSHFWYFEKETTKQWNRMWKSKIWRMHGSLLLYSTWISWYFRIQIIISRLFSIWGKRSRIFAISFTYFYYFIALKHFRSNIWIFQMFLLLLPYKKYGNNCEIFKNHGERNRLSHSCIMHRSSDCQLKLYFTLLFQHSNCKWKTFVSLGFRFNFNHLQFLHFKRLRNSVFLK